MPMAIEASSPAQNHLLCALQPGERERLLPHLQPVTFSLGQIIYEPGERIQYCYFPTNSVVSLLYTTQDGATAEMGLVGNEGVLGVALFLGENQLAAGRSSQSLGMRSGYQPSCCGKNSRIAARFNICCCDTPRRSSRRFHKLRCATACIPWNSGSAVGCCCVTTGKIVRSCS